MAHQRRGTAIAIVGMACRYPDANDVTQLFEHSLAQRRAFRALPAARLGQAYFDEAGSDPDRAYARQAAVIKGFDFDRAAFRVSRRSFESTDLAHWLALTVAHETIGDVRWRHGASAVPGDAVRVVVGNTLTGEFSRAHQLRLRWPFVRAVLGQRLRAAGFDDDALAAMLAETEQRYKGPFPVPDEDFLAGGLANTIAGRICNHFDFRGGGYTVDGACSSSLLAVADACSALAAGDADMALAGGVDLSLDPFELVGFSRTAALARTEMRVYDERSEGFWPGEGCGFVALMRHEDALASCARIHAVIRGWGVSSDGRGGLTRPEADGQALALARCYARAGYDAGTVGYFEGHGTGTRVGDTAELQALIAARTTSGPSAVSAVISSVKANIGHTKAAAGLAGLLRATMCLRAGLRPPTTACQRPHPLLAGAPGRLRTADQIETWDATCGPRRAGVSAMGFGGINAHVTLEEAATADDAAAIAPERLARLAAFQDAELFLFAAASRADLAWTIGHVASLVGECSRAEMTDLAAELARRATRGALVRWKGAFVAATPTEAHRKALLLGESLDAFNGGLLLRAEDGIFLSGDCGPGKIGFVFSGQGSPARACAAIHGRRFPEIRALYCDAGLETFVQRDDTDFAQPAIVTASLAGLALLRRIGVEAEVALGHSLGELSALHWAGYVDAPTVTTLARTRGRAMADDARTAGTMAAVGAPEDRTAKALTGREGVYIANLNGPAQTVISGDAAAIHGAVAALRTDGIEVTPLPVRRAFHTPLMAVTARALRECWRAIEAAPARGRVISTMTGAPLPAALDVAAHLSEQLLAPVRFLRAAEVAAAEVDLLVEVGPGELMTRLTRSFCATPVIGTDIGGDSLAPFLEAAAACYVLGRAPAIGMLFIDRFARPFDWSWKPRFFASPCEMAPQETLPALPAKQAPVENAPVVPPGDTRERLRYFIAERTGLPTWIIHDGSRMLSDLHLNSITVGEIMTQMAAAFDLPPPADPTAYANASVLDIVTALDERVRCGGAAPAADASVQGAAAWIRCFAARLDMAPALAETPQLPDGTWTGHGEQPPYAASLLRRLAAERGKGTIVWLGGQPGAAGLRGLVDAAHESLRLHAQGEAVRYVVVQESWGGGGFSRSFFLENADIPTLLLNLPSADCVAAPDWIAREIAGAPAGFSEISLDATGARHAPRLVPVELPTLAPLPVGAGDVVLVTGGGKGISAECACELARRTGCALLIVGRDAARDSVELAGNLARMGQAGVRVSYQMADVTDADTLAAAIAAGTTQLGAPVTAVVHGAGANRPCMVANLTVADVEATVAPKLTGLRNVLAAVDTARLKALIAFGSIIARIGLPGEADYALANEWLSHEIAAFGARHPHCLCRSIEWSVWSGTGMGQRLGRVDALLAQGISPIPIDDGVAHFLRLLQAGRAPDGTAALIVTGRFGAPPTVDYARVQSGRWRFIQDVLVSYPQTELVAECRLTTATDPYLDDHVLHGERLLPAVMALEAMAEAVAALRGDDGSADTALPLFRDIAFRQAIVVPKDGTCTLRIAAAVTVDGAVALAIRSSATQFHIDHVTARCAPQAFSAVPPCDTAVEDKADLLDPEQSLYRNGLFQTGRFQRIASYQLVEARRCAARLAADDDAAWYVPGLPPAQLLGDPGARDAALHAIQACIPHRTVVPVAVESLHCGTLDAHRPHRMLATEVEDRGAELVYDLTVFDDAGVPLEHWHRLTLRVIGESAGFRLNAAPLMAAFFERQMAQAEPGAALTVTLMPAERSYTDGAPGTHVSRHVGRPEASVDGRFVSRAYSSRWQLEVHGGQPLGCDLQAVEPAARAAWPALLGQYGAGLAMSIAAIYGEDFETSAARVWAAHEAMKKAGLCPDAPLTLDPASTSRWTILRSGETTVYGSLIEAAPRTAPACIAVALRPGSASAQGDSETAVTVAK